MSALCADRFGDPRGCLCDVSVQEGALAGVAEARFRVPLEALAEEQGLRVEVAFLAERRAWLAAGRAKVSAAPQAGSSRVTEALYGEEVAVFDERGGFARVRLGQDGYFGWVRSDALTDVRLEPTHRVCALRGHAFAEARVSAEPVLELALGAALRVEGEEEDWLEVALPGGRAFVRRAVLEPLAPLPEPSAAAIVRLAHAFLHAPYLWGGRSAWGLDCSGLVQTVFAAHGLVLPRDADQQEACGDEVAPEEARAADLFFLPGHVMIGIDAGSFIHANAHHMRVTVNGFAEGSYGRRLASELRRVVRLRGLA